MSDSESIKKMLRSVLQSSKSGVSVNKLQSEYRSLCGETIPLKKLGYSKLEDYLRSIPSVVRLEYRMGELTCFAAVCKETAHIAELVARQKTPKKSGRSQVINCKMRFKPSNPYMLNVRPRSSLRQPSAAGSRSHGGYRGFSASGDYRQMDQRFSAFTPVEHRQPASQQVVKQCPVPDRKKKDFVNSHKPQEKPPQQGSRVNQSQSSVYNVELLQSRISELLQSYYSGLWMSKISTVYSEMFGQKLHPQVLKDLEKWTHVCMSIDMCQEELKFVAFHHRLFLIWPSQVEQPSCTNRVDRLVYPPLPPKPSVDPRSCTTNPNPPASPTSSSTSTSHISEHTSEKRAPLLSAPFPKPRFSSNTPLAKPTFIFPPQSVAASSLITSRSPASNTAVAPQPPPGARLAVNANAGCKDNHNLTTAAHNQNTRPLAPTWTLPAGDAAAASPIQPGVDILSLMKVTFSPSPDSPPKTSAATVSAEVRQRLKELLSKYSTGLWVHALPALFLDTYKTPFPEHVLENLTALLDICNVEYPIPGNKDKAILYNSSKTDVEATDSGESQESRSQPLPSGLQVQGPVIPPCLVPPSDQYSSVLVTDAKSSNAVTVRYVGEKYSNSQEAMEDTMRSFYNEGPPQQHLSKPVVGQLVAVRGEDEDELTRAQVMEVMEPDKVKVYYLDYGFSVETNWSNLLELHQDFFRLPFQATNVRLAGLEIFSSHPLVLSTLTNLAVGKILLMETLEPCQPSDMPVTVLYDTSQDEDVNINSTCLKSLQDKTMNNPLTVNVTYQDVCVTNVRADGTIYCQLPSRGTARLCKLLEKMEAFFISQMTSESLVSRPFSGKFCLTRYKGKLSRVEITNMFSPRVIEILYIDLGIPATVEVTDLREIPPVLLKDFTIIPPQAIKCRLADLTVPEGDWSPEAVLWLQEAVLDCQDCKMKISKLEEDKEDRLVYMYLFVSSAGQELDNSINHQLIRSELWQKHTAQNNNTIKTSDIDMDTVEKSPLSSLVPNRVVKELIQPCHRAEDLSHLDTNTTTEQQQQLKLPPSLEFPQPGQNLDVFVPVACHPGYFVLQPWQDLHKLVVLMGEMILYYNQTLNTNTTTHIQKGEVFAAKIDKNWHRVQVKGILANGFVSVYELDHGKHELVRSNAIRPLIEEFRQLPFQAITAQLAGMTQHQWSEEASMLFRNHVEKRALVAHVESAQDSSETGELWDRRLTVYLVDTTLEDRDVWIHSIMADIGSELSSAA